MVVAAISDLAKVGKKSARMPLIVSSLLAMAALGSASLLYLNAHFPGQLPARTVNEPAATKDSVRGGVTTLQEMLRSVGQYSGLPNNLFDAKTEEAVKSFQRSEGLRADGKPGAKTLVRLYEKSGGTFSLYTAATARYPSGVAR
jgi:murein L,D-transpeptidase YcbB/YkuD